MLYVVISALHVTYLYYFVLETTGYDKLLISSRRNINFLTVTNIAGAFDTQTAQ